LPQNNQFGRAAVKSRDAFKTAGVFVPLYRGVEAKAFNPIVDN